MSPRVIQMPLSGGDRKSFARELRRVEGQHAGIVKKVAAAHAFADEHLQVAHRLECDEWSMRLFLGGDIEPSPRICDAVNAGVTLLEVKCGSCRISRIVDLAEVIWPREKPLHTLRPKLFCQPCLQATRRKIRPVLIRLDMPSRLGGRCPFRPAA